MADELQLKGLMGSDAENVEEKLVLKKKPVQKANYIPPPTVGQKGGLPPLNSEVHISDH